MKGSWKHEPFFIVEDNVLTPREVEIAKQEVSNEKYTRVQTKFFQYDRFTIENDKPRLKKMVEAVVFQSKWWEMALGVPDLAWACSPMYYTVSITKYNEGDFYLWHSDASGGAVKSSRSRALSFIIYLTDKGFTGGETQMSMSCGRFIADDTEKVWKSVTPKVGRMLLFPSYLLHRVTKVTGKEPRQVINGHLNTTEL